MSKFCPIVNRDVVYLVCNECEDKLCECEKDLSAMSEGIADENENTVNNARKDEFR